MDEQHSTLIREMLLEATPNPTSQAYVVSATLAEVDEQHLGELAYASGDVAVRHND